MLSGAPDEEGAFRMLRTRAHLTEAGRERLEADIARLLQDYSDPEAPAVDLMMLSVRQSAAPDG
jgi:hypothetical protein